MCSDEYLLFSITYRQQGQYKFSNSLGICHIDTDSKDAEDGKFSSLWNLEYFQQS